MGKVNALAILLNNNQQIYFPGQHVQGKVVVDVKDDLKVREIRLRFHGYADVHFTESESRGTGDNRRMVAKFYTNHDTYCDHTTTLLGSETGSDHLIMKPGRYEYPFNFQLPKYCGTSFEGSVGHVRYYLHVTIDRPWAIDDEAKLLITVIRMLDLNKVENATHWVKNENSKMLCCWCCASGPITGKIELDRKGYVPGEGIPIKAECINHSRRKMTHTKVELIMTTTYHATSKSISETTVVAECFKGSVPAGESEIWHGEKLVVPALPASGLPGCSFIDIDYHLEFVVRPFGPAFDLEVPVSVIIGNIPLKSAVEQYGVPPPIVQFSGRSDPAYPPPPPLKLPPNMPQPSFSYSVLGPIRGGLEEAEDSVQQPSSSNAVHPQNSDTWTPMYTYYNWNQPDHKFKTRTK